MILRSILAPDFFVTFGNRLKPGQIDLSMILHAITHRGYPGIHFRNLALDLNSGKIGF